MKSLFDKDMRESHARYIYFKEIEGASKERIEEVNKQFIEYIRESARETQRKYENGILEMC